MSVRMYFRGTRTVRFTYHTIKYSYCGRKGWYNQEFYLLYETAAITATNKVQEYTARSNVKVKKSGEYAIDTPAAIPMMQDIRKTMRRPYLFIQQQMQIYIIKLMKIKDKKITNICVSGTTARIIKYPHTMWKSGIFSQSPLSLCFECHLTRNNQHICHY